MVRHFFTAPANCEVGSEPLGSALSDDNLPTLERFVFQALRAIDSDSPEVHALRHACARCAEQDPGDSIASYALIFVAQANDAVVGTLRVTCRQDGPVESGAIFPAWVLTKFGQCAAGTHACQHLEISHGSQIMDLLHDFRGPIAEKLKVNVNLHKVRVEQQVSAQKRWLAALVEPRWSAARVRRPRRDDQDLECKHRSRAELVGRTLRRRSAAGLEQRWLALGFVEPRWERADLGPRPEQRSPARV